MIDFTGLVFYILKNPKRTFAGIDGKMQIL